MGYQYWRNPVGPFHTVDGAAYASSVALTDVSPGGSTDPVVLPAKSLEPGQAIELYAAGFFSNTGTPTLILGFYFGGVAGVALAASTAVATTTGAALWPFEIEYKGRVRSSGPTGQIVGHGRLWLPTSLTAQTPRPIPETAALRTVTIDTTVAKAITVGAQWGTSNAANTLTVQELLVELPN
jgi:hypothetical protein